MNALTISIARVLTTFVIGFLVNLPVTPAILNALNISTDQAAAYVGAGVTALVGFVYFAIVRWLEERRGQRWGRLLAVPAKPHYVADRDMP